MHSRNVFSELRVKITLLRFKKKRKKSNGNRQCSVLPVMYQIDACIVLNSRGIRWLPSPEACRLPIWYKIVNQPMPGKQNGTRKLYYTKGLLYLLDTSS